MAKVIGIFGKPGSGKTCSLRNLPAAETLYLDCDSKGLNWKGWKTNFSSEKHNYYKVSSTRKALEWVYAVDGKELQDDGTTKPKKGDGYKKYKYLIIDTMNALMVNDEFVAMKGKNYDKWRDLAESVWEIIKVANATERDDLTIIMLWHSETVSDENGYMETRILTSGKKLRKLVPESLYNTLLLADKLESGEYIFWTNKFGTTGRTPMGAFDTEYISNDVMDVIKVLEEY